MTKLSITAQNCVLAAAIEKHLRRFEGDPIINAPPRGKMRPYWYPRARATHKYVYVCYAPYEYEYESRLRLDVARAYLAWLDAGNVGKHWQVTAAAGEETKVLDHVVTIPKELLPPRCPACNSTDGMLGTSYAYFICHNMDCYPERRRGCPTLEVYWLGDHGYPTTQGATWEEAVLASPYGPYGSGAALFAPSS